jgi:ligand-binding SRPBCC domain-containing protein
LEDIILEVFVYCSRIDAPSNEVFAWHYRDDAFERLIPPWWRPFIVKDREKKEEEALILVMVVTLRYYSNALS